MSEAGARLGADAALSRDENVTERLRLGGELFMRELSKELYLGHAGLKPHVQLQEIYQRHEQLFSDESLASLRSCFTAATVASQERRAATTMLEWLVDAYVSRRLSQLDERIIHWESSATTQAAGRAHSYQRLTIEISNASDRQLRQELDRARVEMIEAHLEPLKFDRLSAESELVSSLQLAPDYLGTFELLSGVALPVLLDQCRAFIADTDDMWREQLKEFSRSHLGLGEGEATRADAMYLFSARELDAAFPADRLLEVIGGQLSEMGLDLRAAGRIALDVEEREGKRARAFCVPVEIPGEVYLVIRPQGGRNDYRTFLHESGHALHFAGTEATLAFEDRWLGDNSVTESYAMLFDHLVQVDGWVARYSQLPPQQRARYRHRAAFEELHFLRRYCGKLLYEAEVYAAPIDRANARRRFVEIMHRATGFTYPEADAFVDFDPRFYSARYLRAWQLRSLLATVLTERFDDDWYRNPGCGPWLMSELFSLGQMQSADEIARRVANEELGFEHLRRRVEDMLS